jgi:hypothetical protein
VLAISANFDKVFANDGIHPDSGRGNCTFCGKYPCQELTKYGFSNK